MKKAKPLYGHLVCRRCYDGFTNRRHFAFLIDLALLYLFVFQLAVALTLLLMYVGASAETSASIVESASTPLAWAALGFFLFKDSLWGHSPGKLVCGVQVIDQVNGTPIGGLASVKRTLPLLLPVVPLVVAFQLKKGHRWGDSWARSRVVWKKHAANPIFAVAPAPSTPS